MKFKNCSRNRSKLEIKYDIINCLAEEMYITQLLFESNTNHMVAIPILKDLKDKKLVFERKVGKKRVFVLTKKGLDVKKELNLMFKEYLL